MKAYNFDLTAYLQRIHYDSEIESTIGCLRRLHFSQRHTIPFENFDIQLGRPMDLAPEHLFRKLVGSSRGGYCFELNGLFLSALQEIGFDARPLLGRVHLSGEATGRGHQISLVTIDKRQWVTDVGFGGDTPNAPVPLEINTPIEMEGQTLRITKSKNFGFMLQTLRESAWRNLYSFDLEHVCQGDIDYGNHYTSTNPSSIFVKNRIAALPSKNGLLTLFNNTFKSVSGGKESCVEIKDGQEYLDLLEREFGVRLDVPFSSLKNTSPE